ncbi:Major facilitator superfamily and Major facilitator superfamily domain, general substrate transporter and Major facilitator superfamily domain-containing protein [Strongyloides ratti]|uniref:Major facilitator superfamily and Major facilitator superfamily domain, general substrate transporter and Major facilitator superfamily domain-containing protein n=1 Tax=Strongyloides ratti TaxID=34506 RepID=A0A090KVJ3_STRRB|nr:Major facilitator superfamily and Major facilitator superfamily domain, general substrate transporter and Major facilitator superfamily domain-containing protein [Strongyloides ratti]CEF59890.1 Major facilitator superfamily and Major facilitator superfamily domain, general substrate transporter and Major facilitator superfamily domain-containing protein [Strongyloides ratti]
MLLTTVVPIIPEYLLRISHPNQTDEILSKKLPSNPSGIRGKRDAWDDDSWDLPMSPNENIDWDESPFSGMKPPTTKIFSKPKNTSSRKQFYKGKFKNRMTNKKKPTSDKLSDKEYYLKIEKEKKLRHDTLSEENIQVGLMFGSKALVQLIANPMVGPLTNKIGYTIPMFLGFVVMFLSTLMFAFGSSFSTLWFARALQGIGSACTSTSGMGMLAQAYTDDLERSTAMGIALGGLALGVLVGPPYGGILYQWAGKELPFILLALLALCDGLLQFCVLEPKVDKGEQEGNTMKQLIKDPYIIVAAGSITIGNLGIAMLEPSLPLWMMESWQASSFERGIAFLPTSISYLIGTSIFGPLAHKIGRWLSAFIGLIIIGFCLIAIPGAESVYGLIVPNFLMGFSIVDIRHVGVYGSIYAIADAAFCCAFALGPFVSGPLVRNLGFPSMMYIIAVINFIYAPFMYLLKSPPPISNQGSSNPEPPSINPRNLGSENQYQYVDGITNENVTRMQGYQYDY